MEDKNLTPLMKQYWDVKSAHADKLLFFRMGDFYEMFYDDAVQAAPILGIALTQRNKKSEDQTPMCGMPHHSVANHINKLLQHGFKVAMCDQLEDPKSAKGLVKRGVTRILTPGMVYDPDTLDSSLANYMACLEKDVLALLDTTTGEAIYFVSQNPSELVGLFKVLPIVEVVCAPENLDAIKALQLSSLVSPFAGDIDNSLSPACARLLAYVKSLGGEESLNLIRSFEKKELLHRLEVNPTTLRHLEIFSTYNGQFTGSFFKAIDRTKTSGGARLLRQWVCFPLRNLSGILERQKTVEFWRDNMSLLKQVRDVLGEMGDLERRLSRLASSSVNGRDVLSVNHSLRAALSLWGLKPSHFLSETEFQQLADLTHQIEFTLLEEQPLTIKSGYIIKKGVRSELDEWIELSTNSQALVQKMEEEEKQKTGISSLKIRYNNVFGYYIEITNTHKEKVPSHYLRKQTLANAERYCTDELIELEKKVITAQSKRAELEYEIFNELRKKIISLSMVLNRLAQYCSELDVYTGLAWLSLEQKYAKPEFNLDSKLILKGSRHPVVEQVMKTPFVPNDIILDPKKCLLLTGPNMAGKSTLMRQVALTVLLAQMGSYVPASEAKLPVFDRIFTRIGASDQLSEGLSTFMVEMKETSEMLKAASSQTLVILDEVGRGTSTYDGMALAQSILEYLLTDIGCICFFATHYHELTNLEEVFSQIQNAHMTVSEKNGEIQFLHTLVSGPAQKSYGVQVARLAGVPKSVTQRAQVLLKEFENKSMPVEKNAKSVETHLQMSLLDFQNLRSDPTQNELIQEMKDLSISNLTPLEALNRIAKWKEKLY